MTENDPESQKELQLKTNGESKIRTIFSPDEIESTVKGFVLAYIRGIIKIDFPDVKEIQDRKKAEKDEISYKKGFDLEVSIKDKFTKCIEICSGTIPSTSEELRNALHTLFDFILLLRSSHRIKGTFLEYEMEERIDEFEKKLEATNTIVEQLVNWLTDEAKGNDKLP